MRIDIMSNLFYSFLVAPPDNREDTDPERVLAVLKYRDGSKKNWKYDRYSHFVPHNKTQFRGTQRGYSSKPVNIALLNVFKR